MVIYGVWCVGFPSRIIITRKEEIQWSFYMEYLKLVLLLTPELDSFSCWAIPGRCLVSCMLFSSAASEDAQHFIGQGSRATCFLQISAVKYARLFVHVLPSLCGRQLSVGSAGCTEQAGNPGQATLHIETLDTKVAALKSGIALHAIVL